MPAETRTQAARVRRQLPLVVAVTTAVLVLPPVTVSLLLPERSTLVGIGACILLSLMVSRLLAALWRRLPRSRDVLFADLLLWGWLRRLRTERRLAKVDSLMARGVGGPGPGAANSHVRELERISAMVELRDAYTHRHSLRVTRHCEGIAHELGLPEAEVAQIRTAAALHDVGKYYTPRAILNKPGRLTDAEFAVIRRHPGEGADLLEGVVEPDIVAMLRHHHERLGGTGYPDGLAGDAIPLGARIIAVADTFDAMTSNRAYRSACAHKRALDVLHQEAGTALDARAVEAFAAYYSGRRGVYWSNLASGLTQVLTPLRDLLGPAALARTLPAFGAAAALAAPMLPSGADAAPGSQSVRTPVAAHVAAQRVTAFPPSPARIPTATPPAAVITPGPAARREGTERRRQSSTGRGRRGRSHRAPGRPDSPGHGQSPRSRAGGHRSHGRGPKHHGHTPKASVPTSPAHTSPALTPPVPARPVAPPKVVPPGKPVKVPHQK